MTLYLWSQTAATNDDVDSTINWTEGQSPSSVNNSARALMAAVAKWRDDLSGNLVTAGTITAYTLTTNQVFTSLVDGLRVAARMHATNGTDATLKTDALAAKQIRSVYGTNIASGALLINGVYNFVYDSTDDSWIVHDRAGDILTSAGNPDLVAIEALAGTSGGLKKTAANTWALDDFTSALIFIKDGNGTILSTGIAGDISVPMAATITGVRLLADQSGSIVLDLWKDNFSSYPPTVGDTITASAKPTISASTKVRTPPSLVGRHRLPLATRYG